MTLMALLMRCRELSQQSKDSDFSSTSTSEIVVILSRAIESIERDGELNLDELRHLFAPTGALQEVSIDNGWADKFLLLAGQFDRLIGG